MNIKKENGLAGVDTVIAVIALALFSTLIISLIYNNVLENVKLKKETLAMIYITEIFESIGIQDYDTLDTGTFENIEKNDYSENIENLVPTYVLEKYSVDIIITDQLENIEVEDKILKKISVTLNYSVIDKEYVCSMERTKIKE